MLIQNLKSKRNGIQENIDRFKNLNNFVIAVTKKNLTASNCYCSRSIQTQHFQNPDFSYIRQLGYVPNWGLTFSDDGDSRECVGNTDAGCDEGQAHDGVGDAERESDDGDHPNHDVRVERDPNDCNLKFEKGFYFLANYL